MIQDKLSEEHKELVGPAELYERDKVPSMFLPLAKYFLQQIPLQEGEAVLDVACGTGIVARQVAEIVGAESTIMGVDIEADMIEVARANTPPNKPITWHVGNVEDMPFLDSDCFDWVVCQQGYQYFHDKIRALREIRRVLKPTGGVAMIIAQPVNQENQPYQWARVMAFSKHVSPEAGEKQKNLVPFYDGSEDDLQAQMTKAGFREVRVHNEYFTRNREAPEKFVTEEDYMSLEPETRAAVVADIRKAMEPFRTADGTAVPYGFHLAFGYK